MHVSLSPVVQLEQARRDHLAAEVAVSQLKLALLFLGRSFGLGEGLGHHGLVVNFPDVKLVEGLAGRRRVKQVERVRHVVPRVGENHRAAWVVGPVADVVHLARAHKHNA